MPNDPSSASGNAVTPSNRLIPAQDSGVRANHDIREPMAIATSGSRARTPQRKRRGRPAFRMGPILGALLRWGLVAAIWGGVVVAAIVAYFAFTLPDISGLEETGRKPSIRLALADGTVFASSGEVHGRPVKLAELPQSLPQAVLATEDRRFFGHFGLDPIGLVRALVVNLREGAIRQGGSTLTQQLAKNLFLTSERSYGRKIQELILAVWLEWRFTKEQILTIYLNRVYLGAGTFGVAAASERYFAKDPKDLNVYESALIAALRENRIAGAGLDVFVDEPTDPALWAGLDNVVLHPHAGGATFEALDDVLALAVDNLRRFFAGEALLTRVN